MSYCSKCKKILTEKEIVNSAPHLIGYYNVCTYCGDGGCQFTQKNTRNEGVPVKPGDNEPKDKNNNLNSQYCEKCDKWLNHPASYDNYKYYDGGMSEYWTVCRTCLTRRDQSHIYGESTRYCGFCEKTVRITGEKEPKNNMERMLPFRHTAGKVNHDCEAECRECQTKFKPTDETVDLLCNNAKPYCINCRIEDLEKGDFMSGKIKKEDQIILDKLKRIRGNSPTNNNGGNNDNGNSGGGNQSGGNNNQNNSPSLDFLNQLQAYFIANRIESIVKKPNGDLLVKFETNAQSQTITETDANMDNEQRRMWQRFREWLRNNNLNSMNRQQLEKEIEKLNKSSTKPTNYTPWIISGCVIGGLVLIGVTIALIKKSKKKVKK